jgi:phosphatidylglycerophosphatase A
LKRAGEKLAHVLAVWFGCGLVPYAPGTAGTIGAIPLYLALRPLGWAAVAVAAVATTFIGVWAASVVARDTRAKDPQKVVIDEVAGFLVTMLPAAPHGWRSVAVGFVLFRLFDQLKPWPARTAERRWPGGWGIVFDDVFAGIWGAAVLLGLRFAGLLS